LLSAHASLQYFFPFGTTQLQAGCSHLCVVVMKSPLLGQVFAPLKALLCGEYSLRSERVCALRYTQRSIIWPVYLFPFGHHLWMPISRNSIYCICSLSRGI
jgi:hypothetical protein